MYRALFVPFTVLIATLVVSCGGSNETSDSETAPVFLSMGTAPPGGAFFVVGSALAEVITETGVEEGFSVTGEATSGSQENIRRLLTGELDFALSNSAITFFAVRGTEGWDQAYPVRSVMTLAPNVALFVTPTDSGIETLEDLRGNRVTVGPAGAGFEYFVGPLLSAHGISYDDFSPLNATQQAAVDMLTDGSSDAAFLGGAVPTSNPPLTHPQSRISTKQKKPLLPYTRIHPRMPFQPTTWRFCWPCKEKTLTKLPTYQ